jgi:hypothetical protein
MDGAKAKVGVGYKHAGAERTRAKEKRLTMTAIKGCFKHNVFIPDDDYPIPDGRVIIMSGYDTAADGAGQDINRLLERVDTSLPDDLWQASYDILAKAEW